MADDALTSLRDELSQWQELGLQCSLWWRDDDLIANAPPLHPMRQLSERYVVHVLVAVIPRLMDKALGHDASAMHSFVFCQHGFAHRNHEPPGVAKSEFPPSRSWETIATDLADGYALMSHQFGKRFYPVLVPPWNAFPDALIEKLPLLGFVGISQYGPVARQSPPGIVCVNTHMDLVDWSTAPVFPTTRRRFLMDRLVENLQQRRLHNANHPEPLGLLTHHRVMDESAWQFMDEFLEISHQYPCVQWKAPLGPVLPTFFCSTCSSGQWKDNTSIVKSDDNDAF